MKNVELLPVRTSSENGKLSACHVQAQSDICGRVHGLVWQLIQLYVSSSNTIEILFHFFLDTLKFIVKIK